MNLEGTRPLRFGPELGVARHDGSFLFFFVRLSSAQSAVAQGKLLYMFALANTQSVLCTVAIGNVLYMFARANTQSAQSAVAQGNLLYIFARANTQFGTDGHVSGTVDYDVFGEPVTETGVFVGSAGGSGGISALVFAYAGKPYDPVTGLSDYGFRDYAPTLVCEFCEAKSREEKRSFSTFTTVDPIRDGSNWYDIWAASFAKQNLVEKNEVFRPDPVNYVDMWGLCTGDVRTDTPHSFPSSSYYRSTDNEYAQWKQDQEKLNSEKHALEIIKKNGMKLLTQT